MKKLYFLLSCVLFLNSFTSSSQNLGINTNGLPPDSSAILDVRSDSLGILFPRMTDSQRIAIHFPATGLLVYQTNGLPGFYYNMGTSTAPSWILLARHNVLPIVVPGSDTTITLSPSKDSIQLRGSATDEDGTITSFLWSQVSGPNTPVIAAAGSGTTLVKGVINGTYVFQLMATDNSGAAVVKPVSVTVAPAQVTNVSLQPAQNPNEVHMMLYYGGDASDETAPEIGAAAWTNSGSMTLMRGIFKFDLSSIPADATILSARLTLYSNPTPINGNQIDANFGTDNSMLIQRVTSNWSSTVTWYNQPFTDESSQIMIPHTSQTLLDLNQVDVTNMVQAMLPNSNYGFLLKLQNEAAYTSRIFCSSKYSNAAKHPKLEIQYVK